MRATCYAMATDCLAVISSKEYYEICTTQPLVPWKNRSRFKYLILTAFFQS